MKYADLTIHPKASSTGRQRMKTARLARGILRLNSGVVIPEEVQFVELGTLDEDPDKLFLIESEGKNANSRSVQRPKHTPGYLVSVSSGLGTEVKQSYSVEEKKLGKRFMLVLTKID